MPTLPSTINSPAIQRRVCKAARSILGRRRNLVAFYEHGHWWVEDRDSGAQWDAVDAIGDGTVEGFDFEQVSYGDES